MVGTMTLTNEISGRMTSSILYPVNWESGLNCELRSYDRTDGMALPLGITLIFSVSKERSTYQSTVISQEETRFVPRTPLGEKLCALRAKAILAGMRVLSEEEILEEIKRRRGELEEK